MGMSFCAVYEDETENRSTVFETNRRLVYVVRSRSINVVVNYAKIVSY